MTGPGQVAISRNQLCDPFCWDEGLNCAGATWLTTARHHDGHLRRRSGWGSATHHGFKRAGARLLPGQRDVSNPPAVRSAPWDRRACRSQFTPSQPPSPKQPSAAGSTTKAALRCTVACGDSHPGERVALVSVAPPGPGGAYAETGPVFLHAGGCPGPCSWEYPQDWLLRPQVLRAYDDGGAIIGGELVGAGEDQSLHLSDCSLIRRWRFSIPATSSTAATCSPSGGVDLQGRTQPAPST